MTNENSSLKEIFEDMGELFSNTFNENLLPKTNVMKKNVKSKAITISGHLVKLDEGGAFYRLDGNGVWTEISTKELYKLIAE